MFRRLLKERHSIIKAVKYRILRLSGAPFASRKGHHTGISERYASVMKTQARKEKLMHPKSYLRLEK